MTITLIEATATVTAEHTTHGLTYRAAITAAADQRLAGVFGYGESPAAARRALAELIALAVPELAPDAVIRLTVPETYHFDAAVAHV